jgi:hypothetical protein
LVAEQLARQSEKMLADDEIELNDVILEVDTLFEIG